MPSMNFKGNIMKINLNDVVNSVDIVKKLIEYKLPVKTSFRLMTLVKTLDAKLQTFEECRVSLVKKYGELNEETQQISVKPENVEEFAKEYQELLKEEFEVDFSKIGVESLPDDVSISVSELQKVSWLIE